MMPRAMMPRAMRNVRGRNGRGGNEIGTRGKTGGLGHGLVSFSGLGLSAGVYSPLNTSSGMKSGPVALMTTGVKALLRDGALAHIGGQEASCLPDIRSMADPIHIAKFKQTIASSESLFRRSRAGGSPESAKNSPKPARRFIYELDCRLRGNDTGRGNDAGRGGKNDEGKTSS